MNKRIKLKKAMLHKKCNQSCDIHKFIMDNVLITNNCCNRCKLKDSRAINIVLKENETFNNKYDRVTVKKATKIMETREPKGLFWTKEDEWYIAIDNLTGDAWIKSFKTREECFEYLEDSYPLACQCFSPD